jgi:hypothetical protein
MPAHAAAGDEHWDYRFGGRGSVTNLVFAMAWNDGRLYTGGWYAQPAGVTNSPLEVWDGERWSGLGDLYSGFVVIFDMTWFKNELYVGGTFNGVSGVEARGLARWNGTNWSRVGGFDGLVESLLVSGGNLYVGGTFTNVNGAAVKTSERVLVSSYV